jgi:hypothetical protein
MYCILNIIPYIISEKYLSKLNEDCKQNREYFYKKLPKYCLRENGTIANTNNYHMYNEFVVPKENQYYYMFEAEPIEPILKEEISEGGLEYLLKEFNLNILFKKLSEKPKTIFKDCDSITKLLKPKMLNDIEYLGIPESVNIILELNYIGDYEDVDLDINLIGYLDENLNIVKI